MKKLCNCMSQPQYHLDTCPIYDSRGVLKVSALDHKDLISLWYDKFYEHTYTTKELHSKNMPNTLFENIVFNTFSNGGSMLTLLHDEYLNRKALFNAKGYLSIDDYNKNSKLKLRRIIILMNKPRDYPNFNETQYNNILINCRNMGFSIIQTNN